MMPNMVYDAEYGHHRDDLNVFVGIKTEGAALDLACGAGLLTIELAKSGLVCTGLDICNVVLERACSKSQNLNISYIKGDMRRFIGKNLI